MTRSSATLRALARASAVAMFLGVVVLAPARADAQARSAPRTKNWNQDHDPFVAAIGLGLGYTSGTGLAVRWPALPQVMVTVTGGAWGSADDLNWNLGLEAHLVLRQVGKVRVLLGPAAAFFSDNDENDVDLNVGFGVGVEYLATSRLAVKADLGFSYLGDDGDVFPLPQVAALYYF